MNQIVTNMANDNINALVKKKMRRAAMEAANGDVYRSNWRILASGTDDSCLPYFDFGC